jgi:type IV secretion system protein VirB10
VDPAKLELRARPRPAVQFRKGLIVCLSAAIAAFIAIVSWFALDPPGFRLAPPAPASQMGRQPADVLKDAPASYDQVPILGPPLPGDLGRPILKHRSAMGQPPSAPLDDDHRHREQERTAAASSSSLMVSLTERPRAAEAVAAGAADGKLSGTAPSPGSNPKPAPLPVLAAGTIIPATLITGINSDVPGIVLAQVTEPVRDTATGELVLIPQGSKLVGDYDARIAHGQSRAMLSWNRLVLPDGRSLALDKLPAADRAGFAGLADEVDFHGWRLLKGVALSTALGIGNELSMGDSDQALVRALGDSAQMAGSRAGDEITRRNLDIKPTIKIRPGWPVRLILHEDLSLESWKA